MHTPVTIIVTYNSADQVVACIDALLADGLNETDLLAWDNASTDRSVEAVRRAAPRCELVANRTNAGFAAAVNAAARMRPGRDLFLVNPDAEVERGTLAGLGAGLGRPGVAVVGALITTHGRVVQSAWRFPTPRRVLLGTLLGFGRVSAPRTSTVDGLVDVGDAFVPFTCAAVSREKFDALGGLDERFWLYGEDADFGYRAWSRGWRSVLAPGAQAIHLGQASSPGLSGLRLQLRGDEAFRRKHFGSARSRLSQGVLLLAAEARVRYGEVRARLGLAEPPGLEAWRLVRRETRTR